MEVKAYSFFVRKPQFEVVAREKLTIGAEVFTTGELETRHHRSGGRGERAGEECYISTSTQLYPSLFLSS